MSDTRATYKDAGVDIDAGLRRIPNEGRRFGDPRPAVLAGVGAFGGCSPSRGSPIWQSLSWRHRLTAWARKAHRKSVQPL